MSNKDPHQNVKCIVSSWLEKVDAYISNEFKNKDEIINTWNVAFVGRVINNELEEPLSHLFVNLRCNIFQWILEDIVRDPKANPGTIKQIKSSIDISNQRRNDAIENFNDYIATVYLSNMDTTKPLFSETPGSILDRINILAIKKYNFSELKNSNTLDEIHKQEIATKLNDIISQLSDLREALNYLLDSVSDGIMHFRLYKQHKIYNDAKFNPYLRGHQK